MCVCPPFPGGAVLVKDSEGCVVPAAQHILCQGSAPHRLTVFFMEHWLIYQNVAVLSTCLSPSVCLTSESK